MVSWLPNGLTPLGQSAHALDLTDGGRGTESIRRADVPPCRNQGQKSRRLRGLQKSIHLRKGSRTATAPSDADTELAFLRRPRPTTSASAHTTVLSADASTPAPTNESEISHH